MQKGTHRQASHIGLCQAGRKGVRTLACGFLGGSSLDGRGLVFRSDPFSLCCGLQGAYTCTQTPQPTAPKQACRYLTSHVRTAPRSVVAADALFPPLPKVPASRALAQQRRQLDGPPLPLVPVQAPTRTRTLQSRDNMRVCGEGGGYGAHRTAGVLLPHLCGSKGSGTRFHCGGPNLGPILRSSLGHLQGALQLLQPCLGFSKVSLPM
jgi:hypothetical protein